MKPQSPSLEATDTLLVLTNLPDRESAEKIAEHLVTHKLAACVNVLAPCTSIYHWQGKIEHAQEIPLIIKTTTRNYPAVEQAIQALHPYELPEIIHVPVTGGLPAYLTWLHQETKA